jgi:hypothetical protein
MRGAPPGRRVRAQGSWVGSARQSRRSGCETRSRSTMPALPEFVSAPTTTCARSLPSGPWIARTLSAPKRPRCTALIPPGPHELTVGRDAHDTALARDEEPIAVAQRRAGGIEVELDAADHHAARELHERDRALGARLREHEQERALHGGRRAAPASAGAGSSGAHRSRGSSATSVLRIVSTSGVVAGPVRMHGAYREVGRHVESRSRTRGRSVHRSTRRLSLRVLA